VTIQDLERLDELLSKYLKSTQSQGSPAATVKLETALLLVLKYVRALHSRKLRAVEGLNG